MDRILFVFQKPLSLIELTFYPAALAVTGEKRLATAASFDVSAAIDT